MLNHVESCWIVDHDFEHVWLSWFRDWRRHHRSPSGPSGVQQGYWGCIHSRRPALNLRQVSPQRLLQCSWTPNSTVTFWPFLGNSGCAILQLSFILRMSGVIFHLMIMTWAKAGDMHGSLGSEGPWALEKLSCEVSLTIFQAHHTGKQVDSNCHPLWHEYIIIIIYYRFGSYVYTYCILSLSCFVH